MGKRRGGRLARTNKSKVQNAAGVSKQDNVRSVRKFMIFDQCPISNATVDYNYGIKNFNVSGNGSPLANLLDDYSYMFEQYRVRRVIIRATPGKGFTMNRKLKTFVAARVDVDQQISGSTIRDFKALLNAENTVVKTFAERSNVKIADFRPQCRVNTTASMPVLPNRLQFYPIGDYRTHFWKGCTVASFLPETLTPNECNVTLTAEVDVEFRGRVTAPRLYDLSDHINQDASPAPPTYDLTLLWTEVKNKVLTGAYFPLSGWTSINAGNLGATVPSTVQVTDQSLVGLEVRDQSDMKKYRCEAYTIDTSHWNEFE